MRNRTGKLRISAGATVYMAAVMEYICAELLNAAKDETLDKNKKRIGCRKLEVAIRSDEELANLFKNGSVAASGGASLKPYAKLLVSEKPSNPFMNLFSGKKEP